MILTYNDLIVVYLGRPILLSGFLSPTDPLRANIEKS
jgi:hypothetical protein